MTTVDESEKVMKNELFSHLQDKRKNLKAHFQLRQLVRSADFEELTQKEIEQITATSYIQ